MRRFHFTIISAKLCKFVACILKIDARVLLSEGGIFFYLFCTQGRVYNLRKTLNLDSVSSVVVLYETYILLDYKIVLRQNIHSG